MPHIKRIRRTPAITAIVVPALVLACLGLAACGGSSKSATTNASASAATSTTNASASSGTGSTAASAGPGTGSTAGAPTGATGPNVGRFAALRECLKKNGITLPQRTPGGGAGPQLPKGVTRAQYEAALKKCGGTGQFARTGKAFNVPAFKAAFAKFATCLRQNGVNVPAQNTSGKGPVFNTKGINTSSAQFRTAETKCQSILVGAFRGGSGAGGPG
jgi:hypothetical protein